MSHPSDPKPDPKPDKTKAPSKARISIPWGEGEREREREKERHASGGKWKMFFCDDWPCSKLSVGCAFYQAKMERESFPVRCFVFAGIADLCLTSQIRTLHLSEPALPGILN